MYMASLMFLIPPFLHIHIYNAIFGKYQCFISLTFSLGPDEAATGGGCESLSVILMSFYFVLATSWSPNYGFKQR